MSLFKIILRFVSVVLFLILIQQYLYDDIIPQDFLSIIVILCSICQLSMAFTNNYVYRSGTTMMFLIYNVLCHNGFVIAAYFNRNYEEFKSVTSMDFLSYTQSYQNAILISNIVLFVFVFCLEFYKNFNYKVLTKNNLKLCIIHKTTSLTGYNRVDRIGIPILIVGTLYIVGLALMFNLFGSGYSLFLSVVESLPLYGHFVVLNSLSIAFIIASGSDKGIKVSIIIFIIQAIFQFSMGNRGEILYSAVVCIALITLRYKSISFKYVALIGVGLIFLIPYIRYMRELKQNDFNPYLSILDTFCEEGMQISPFTHIVEYVKMKGEYAWGMTYVNDFSDFIFRRFGIESPFYIEKYVIKMIMPYQGMGFSLIAELFYNFTIWGACVAYGLISRFLCKLDYYVFTNQYSNLQKAFYSMLVVQLINMTRNDGSTLPIYLMYMLIIISVYFLIKK